MPQSKLIVFAGPNGSGKSTLTRQLQIQEFELGEYINPDEIATELEGSYEWRVRAAQKIADKRRDACILEQRSFSFETVMSHPSKIEVMRRARDAGFYVTLYFVGTEDPRINIERVSNRVRLGGHDVPIDKITLRFGRAMHNLLDAVLVAHKTVIFDSSTASNIKPILEVVSSYSSEHALLNFDRYDYVSNKVNRWLPRWVKNHLFVRLKQRLSTDNKGLSIWIRLF